MRSGSGTVGAFAGLGVLCVTVSVVLYGVRLAALGGVVSLLCFSPILWALLSEPWTGVRWWRAIPLGGVERLLGLAEVATVLLLAWWAVHATRCSEVPSSSR